MSVYHVAEHRMGLGGPMTRRICFGAEAYCRSSSESRTADRRGQSTVITDDVCVVALPLLENELRVISVSVGRCVTVTAWMGAAATMQGATVAECVDAENVLPKRMPPGLPNHRPKTWCGLLTATEWQTGGAALIGATTDDATVAFRTLS